MSPPGIDRLRGGKRRGRGAALPRHPLNEPNPLHPDVVSEHRLFAVLGTWMEQDIVEATVRNALAQGVEAVYLVDNASTDATVERATAAGATLAESYRTEVYEERVRILLMNAVVARVSLAADTAHIWWLWLDGDEFPEGPGGSTIADYVAGLDRRFRLVGSTYYNHFPDRAPQYVSGFHPIDFQPLCEQFVPDQPRYCPQPHWKHPLQRFDRQGPFLGAMQGFHGATVLMGGQVVEPVGGLVTHHFPYRDEAVTKKRMELLCGIDDRNAYNDSIGNSSIKKRFDTLDAVYRGQWDRVDSLTSHQPRLGVHPEPWAHPTSTRRWYEPGDVEAARKVPTPGS
jgi:glycosyltransferase involved in cell wall biosynthesis